MKIGVLGATGPAGSALAVRLASIGQPVIVGSRSLDRAEQCRDALLAAWPGRDLAIEAAENDGAAGADVVVVATPWDGAAPTAASLAEALAGKVVISMANALARVGNELQALIPPRGSIAADVQAAVPDALVAAAFHHVPAKELGDIDHDLDCDVMVCSDHAEATKVTAELIGRMPAMRAVDAGGLGAASALEAFTAVLIGMNVRYKSRLSVRLTGLPG